MIKHGDKLLCKITNDSNFIENVTYTVEAVNYYSTTHTTIPRQYWNSVKKDPMETLFYVRIINTVISSFELYEYYFYTKQESRKLKLNKLNKTNE